MADVLRNLVVNGGSAKLDSFVSAEMENGDLVVTVRRAYEDQGIEMCFSNLDPEDCEEVAEEIAYAAA